MWQHKKKQYIIASLIETTTEMRGAHKYCTFSLLRKDLRKYQNTSSDHCNTCTNNI